MNLKAILRRAAFALVRTGSLLTIAAVILALAVWFLGPMISYDGSRPLAPAAVRLALLLLVAILWGIGSFFFRARRSKDERALLEGLRKQREEASAAADQATAALEDELARFRDAARGAMRFLRRARGGLFSNPRYVLPWYFVVGGEGAGKTAVVRNAGLTQPSDGGVTEEKGFAGFHITEQAVLVEFSGQILDRSDKRAVALWQRALDHLRRLRPRQPVNGTIIVVSVGELASMSADAGLDFAETVRRRVDEVAERLRTRAPVYLIVSKLDEIVGFGEFFETLTAEERASVLGFPIAGTKDGEGADVFSAGFDDILERLSAQHLARLQEEPDELRRRRIFEFSPQFAALKARLEPLVRQLTASHRFSARPLLRGVFFTSATQTEAVADMLARSLAGDFGQTPQQMPVAGDLVSETGRPYFLRGILRDVLLPEANVSGLTRPALVATRVRDVAANVALTLLAIVAASFWWTAFSEGRAFNARLAEQTSAARASILQAAPEGQLPSRFEPVLGVLDDLKQLSEERPRRATLGLYSTSSAQEASRDAYERALAGMLFPFVWRYLEDGLDDPRTPAALRFHQLKLYLMLSGERPVSHQTAALLGPDFAANWLLYDRTAEVERRVSEHFAGLASVPVAAPLSDLSLVDRARGRISDYTLARLAYDTALSLPAVQQLPLWRPIDHMGLAAPQALSRVSGASFWDGIRGIYTSAGFENVMLRISGTVSDSIAADLWVMGTDETLDLEREASRIRQGVLDLYRVDYITRWDRLLSDLGMADGASAGEVARALAIIIGSPSPVIEITSAIAEETRLEESSDAVPGTLPGGAGQVIQDLVDATPFAPQRVTNVARSVTAHFQAVRQAVTADEGQQTQVGVLLAAMEPLYRQINHVATGGDILELGAEPQTLLNQLSGQTDALPQPLQPLFRRILSQAEAVTGGSSRERLSQIWSTMVLPLCTATTSARYPFDRGSSNDTSLDDFANLFGPNGAITAFRNDYLRPFVDTTARPWRWRAGPGGGLGFDDSVLGAFELAADITAAYFGGADAPSVNFTVEPITLDPRARAFQLDIGGPTLVYSHGPPTVTPYRWPVESGVDAMMSMTPEIDGERNMLRRQGPWALFRLFDAGRVLERDTTDVVPYQFTIGSRQILLVVTAPPTSNPFSRDILSEFSCPRL